MDDFYEPLIADAVAEKEAAAQEEASNTPQLENGVIGTQHWEQIKTLWGEYQQVTAQEAAAKTRSNQLRIELGREFRALQEDHAKPGHGDFLELLPTKLEELGISISIKTVYDWIKLSREADGLEVRRTRSSKRSENSSFTQVKDDAPQQESPRVTAESFTVADDDDAGGTPENTAPITGEPDAQAEPQPVGREPKSREEELCERFRALLLAPETDPILEFYSIVFAAAKLLDVPHNVLTGVGITVYRKAGVAKQAVADEAAAGAAA